MGVAPDELATTTASRSRPVASSYYLDEDDTETPQKKPKPQTKRKRAAASYEDESDEDLKSKKKAKFTKKGKGRDKDEGEKRLGRWRAKPPVSYQALLERAQTQRMFVIERVRTGTTDNPSETIEIAGSTGNLYTVTISNKTTCNCPYAVKGHECKHIVYVMHRTLKAPPQLQFQRYLLSSELKEIFARAPPIPSDKGNEEKEDDGSRKPIDDDCPICCVEFDAEKDSIIYCKAACGNNVHKGCFEQWAAQKRAQGGGVTCPFCRTPWEGEVEKAGAVDKSKGLNRDGYVNVADQLGLSGMRDTRTYHQIWVNKERRAGRLLDEDPASALWYR